MSAAIAVDENQQRLVPPLADIRVLQSIIVHNPSPDTPAYLNVWDDLDTSGSPARPIASVMDQIPIAAGFNGTIFLDRLASGSLVISASTGLDGTGAPDLDFTVGGFRWVAG